METKPGMPYDDSNIFARILRGELPCNRVYEDAFALAFHDIHRQAPMHVLVIPKGKYVSFADFGVMATSEEINGFTQAVARVARELGLEDGGYRLVVNVGQHGHQDVPHLHMHILGGEQFSHKLAAPETGAIRNEIV